MSTKIIQILKDDKPEDIISEFENSDAGEVIFIFPNNSKFGQNESHFKAISYEAIKSGKIVTVLSSNNIVKDFSEKYNFQFIKSPQDNNMRLTIDDTETSIKDSGDEQPVSEVIEKINYPDEENIEEKTESDIRSSESNSFETENEDQKEEAINIRNEGESIIASLAVKKTMADIVSPKKEKEIPVKEGKNKKSEIEIKSYKTPDKTSLIEKIWFSKKERVEKKRSGNKNFSKKNLILFITISIITLLGIIYSTLGSAQIIINPQTQRLDFQIKVSASSHNKRVDPLFNTLPGEYFIIEKSETKTVPTTGQKEVAQKAKGKIIIINAFSSSPQPLVATTRFETPDGLIFRIPKSIVIPGITVENGIQEFGKLEIEVIADQAGEKYNIEPTNFTIPGLKGGPKFEKIYAESKSKMTGGIIGLANIVTEEDINGSREELKNNIVEKIKNETQNKSSGFITVESLEPEIVSEELSNKAGEAATQLTLKITARLNTVAFYEADIIELINSFIQKTGDLVLIKDSLSIEYKNPKINEKEESLSFDLLVKGSAGLKIDEKKVIEKLAGLKEKEIKDSIKSMPEIETVKIILSPFWVSRMPEDINKIKSKIEYK